MTRLRHYAHLGRVGMSPLTISVPILSTFAIAENSVSTAYWVGLIGLGLTTHLFGFALNDLIDHPVDRTHPSRQNHPLTTGELSLREAWIFTLLQIPLAFFCLIGLLGGDWPAIGVLVASLLCSIIYDKWSKWGRLPRLIPEIALAASVSLLGISAMFARTDTPPNRAILWAAVLGMGLLLLNSVASGLKDLKTDGAYGARSFVLSTGTRMVDEDTLEISTPLRWYAAILQALVLVGTGILLVQFSPPIPLIILSIILSIYGALHLRMLLGIRSFQGLLASIPLLNGHYTYTAIVLIVIDRLPLLFQLLIGWLVIIILLPPIRLAISMWRRGYQPIS